MPTITFYSYHHTRIESGRVVSNDSAYRLIVLNYSNFGRRLKISIQPTLSPKMATCISDSNSVLTYVGDDRDFRFEIETKPDNTIKRVSLFRLDKNLELRYYE